MICVTIKENNCKNVVNRIKEIYRLTDVVEVRVDYISKLESSDLKKIIGKSKKKLIITNRHDKEFGQYKGDENSRLLLLKRAIDYGADFVDIELLSGRTQELIDYRDKVGSKTKIICSYHNFKVTKYNEIHRMYDVIKKLGVDVIKIISFANDINDNLIIYQLLKKAKLDKINLIAFCMGEYGISSRILCLKYGSFLTFSAVESGKETASGQLSLYVMKKIYNCSKINSSTKVYGLVGNPVDKSKGYLIHNLNFRGENCVYVNFLVDDINWFLDKYRDIIDGLSVTMPFKEIACKYVDGLDKYASAIGSLNTITKVKGNLIGSNTDFIGGLKALNCKIKGKKVFIIGTGGLSRALSYGVVSSGGKVVIGGRKIESLHYLSKKFNTSFVLIENLKKLEGYSIIINATSVGMAPNANRSLINPDFFKKGMIVFDGVYNPLETKMIRDAKKKGCKVVQGYKLFLYQALEQQKLFGYKIKKVKLLEKVLVNSLKKSKEVKEINVVSKKVNVSVRVSGSKSITNRALLIAALAFGKSVIKDPLMSDDTKYMIQALNVLGVKIEINNHEIIVHGQGGKFKSDQRLVIGNAGTAMRFLIGLCSIIEGKTTIDGNLRMRKRPIKDLLHGLRQLGVESKSKYGCPPVDVFGGTLSGGNVVIKGDVSSQFLSSLLMIAPYASSKVIIRIDGLLFSKPYVDITIKVMKKFGVDVLNQNYKKFTVKQGVYTSCNYDVEADASNASYFFGAAAVTGGTVLVKGISRNSIQGDIKFLKILEKMGCNVSYGKDFVKVSGGKLKGVTVDMNDIPDVAQTLAVVALFAKGKTRIKNVANLRVKETDRIRALVLELRKLGGKITEYKDGLLIEPRKLKGNIIETYDDHRMAMSFALAGLRINGVKIKDPLCVNKSFPNYWKEFGKLYW